MPGYVAVLRAASLTCLRERIQGITGTSSTKIAKKFAKVQAISVVFPFARTAQYVDVMIRHNHPRASVQLGNAESANFEIKGRKVILSARLRIQTLQTDLEVLAMTHAALLILMMAHSFFNTPIVQQPEPLLIIVFSLDSKADQEIGHVVIRYSLTKEGQEFDVRDVYDWAHQASHHRQLSRDKVAKIAALLQRLPSSEIGDTPKDWLVTVTFRTGKEVRVREYHRKRLPRSLKEILEQLRGIRFELRETIGFSAASY
jgi:hypothetical protein